MTEQERIAQVYREMYRAIIAKDTAALNAVLADEFVLVHMTGMHQPKTAFIAAVADGTLNYYTVQHENIEVRVNGDTAALLGQSCVNAAVFGGRAHTWRLQQKITVKKNADRWQITGAQASTY